MPPEHSRPQTEPSNSRYRYLSLARAVFRGPYERAVRHSGSDPKALRNLVSKGGLKLYYSHIPEAKGEILNVQYADDAPESD